MKILASVIVLAMLVFFNWAIDYITFNLEFPKIMEAVIRRVEVCILGSYFFIMSILPAEMIYVTIVMSCALALYEVWCRREDILERDDCRKNVWR